MIVYIFDKSIFNNIKREKSSLMSNRKHKKTHINAGFK